MLSTASNYLATAKRVRTSLRQSQAATAALAQAAEEENTRATELLAEIEDYNPVIGTTHTALTVRDTFAGNIQSTRIQFPFFSTTLWQTESLLSGDITVYNRVPLYLPGLSSTEEGIPLLLTDLTVTSTLRVKGAGLHVPSLKFPTFTTPQTVPYSAAVIAEYTAKVGLFPSTVALMVIQNVDAWPNIPLTSTSVTQLNSASAGSVNNGNGAFILAPQIPLPTPLPAKNSSLLTTLNTAPLNFYYRATTSLLMKSRETGNSSVNADMNLAGNTIYNRWFYVDSRLHYDLPIATNLTRVVGALMPNSSNVYGPASALRPMFIYHPSAIISVQASFVLAEMAKIDRIEIWIRMRRRNGAIISLFGGHPYVLGVHESLGIAGLQDEEGTVTVNAPLFQFPLNNIGVTNDSASVQVAINAHFLTEPSTIKPGDVFETLDSRIDCMIYINSTSF